MEKNVIINGEFFFGLNNLSIAPRMIKKNFRFSLWNRGMLYTPGELLEIIGVDAIYPGETAKVKVMIMNGMLAESLNRDDVLNWGVPYNSVGTLRIL